MATCAILGQALGTAVSLAVKNDMPLDKINVKELQNALLEDDCYIPYVKREVPPLTKKAVCNAEIVRNGEERKEENLWTGKKGDYIEYEWDTEEKIKEIRLVFDSDMNRDYDNMPCYYPLKETKFRLPETLVKDYVIEGEKENGEKVKLEVKDNYLRFVRHKVDWKVKKNKTYAACDFRRGKYEGFRLRSEVNRFFIKK